MSERKHAGDPPASCCDRAVETLPPRRLLRLIGDALLLEIPVARRVRAPQTAEDMVSAASKNIDTCRCQMLKMPAAMATYQLRLVDTVVLEGMGLPTAGVDSRSKSPTDPTALVVRQ